ncbi:MAG: hypothetical protein M3N07_04370, partial [Pseudomonadota bacterium]|nr:hypothetical protein [Pseudomonadota bacterium]
MRAASIAALLWAGGCTTIPRPPETAAPAAPAAAAEVRWPAVQSPLPRDPALEARVESLLAGMTLEQKVAQVIQPD